MAATSIPGIEVIQAAAASAGIDISATITKAQQIMAADPATMRAGSTQLRTVASGLDTTGQDVRRTGTQLLATWTGSSATAFAPAHADVVNQLGTHQQNASQLAGSLDSAASGFESCQHVVVTATGIAATAIGAAQATP
jgi:uncharacterized protein YukE